MLQAVTLQSERPLKKLLTNSKRSTIRAQAWSSGDGAHPPGWTLPSLKAEGKAKPRPVLHVLGTQGSANMAQTLHRSFPRGEQNTVHCWGNQTEDASYPT